MARLRQGTRKQEILTSLAHMLEAAPEDRITIAKLAREVGVSEAALYKHFPSKTRMFEGLIEFVEDTLFKRIQIILHQESDALLRCKNIVQLLLMFVTRNPGISRILSGDAITGEDVRLHKRVNQLFARLETQLKQVLREGKIQSPQLASLDLMATVDMMMSMMDGKIRRYVRSGFTQKPLNNWETQWQIMANGAMTTRTVQPATQAETA
jgi:TetR/AcrR family transcriptional regulator